MVRSQPTYKGKRPLNASQLIAAKMIASNEMTFGRIAEELKITEITLMNWRSRADFQQKVAEYAEGIVQATSTLKFSARNRRIEALNKLAEDYEIIMQERAAWYAEHLPEVPGGRTGHLVHQIKVVGVGKNAQVVEEDVLDKALDEGFKDTLVHIAKERGEWAEKREVTGINGSPLLPISEIVVKLTQRDDAEKETEA